MRTTIALLFALMLAAQASAATPPLPSTPAPTLCDDAVGADVHPQRRRLRTRRRAEPVRRDGAGEGEPELSRHPRLLLPRHHDRRGAARKVRVLVADAKPAVKISSTVPFKVVDATGFETPLPAGEVPLKPALKLPVDGQPTALPGPLRSSPGRAAR